MNLPHAPLRMHPSRFGRNDVETFCVECSNFAHKIVTEELGRQFHNFHLMFIELAQRENVKHSTVFRQSNVATVRIALECLSSFPVRLKPVTGLNFAQLAMQRLPTFATVDKGFLYPDQVAKRNFPSQIPAGWLSVTQSTINPEKLTWNFSSSPFNSFIRNFDAAVLNKFTKKSIQCSLVRKKPFRASQLKAIHDSTCRHGRFLCVS